MWAHAHAHDTFTCAREQGTKKGEPRAEARDPPVSCERYSASSAISSAFVMRASVFASGAAFG